MFQERLANRFGQSGWREAEEASCCNRFLLPAQGDEDFAGVSLTQSINNSVVHSVLQSFTSSLF